MQQVNILHLPTFLDRIKGSLFTFLIDLFLSVKECLTLSPCSHVIPSQNSNNKWHEECSFIYPCPAVTSLLASGASTWRLYSWVCACVCGGVAVGGPAHGLVGERGVVPAATTTDISELFIKRMTTLSSPISGPSCTGVLLLLSGRVSSILLPCYSLELLMANTIPPFLPGLSRLTAWNQAWWRGSAR